LEFQLSNKIHFYPLITIIGTEVRGCQGNQPTKTGESSFKDRELDTHHKAKNRGQDKKKQRDKLWS
jgi:hypothetical protein